MVEGQAQDRVRRFAAAATHRACAVALLAGVLLLPATGARAEACTPWPGEPAPLPRVDDRDEMRARWATLRVRELADAATAAEAAAPLRAHRLWRRVLCIDPASDAAVAGIARTPAVVVHRPALVTTPTADADEPSDAYAALSQPLRVLPPPPAPEPEPQAPAFEALLAELEADVRRARFEEALAGVAPARDAAANDEQTARVEVLAATAALALGRSDEADASLRRALAADPELRLDAATTPPKVRRALDRVRAEGAP